MDNTRVSIPKMTAQAGTGTSSTGDAPERLGASGNEIERRHRIRQVSAEPRRSAHRVRVRVAGSAPADAILQSSACNTRAAFAIRPALIPDLALSHLPPIIVPKRVLLGRGEEEWTLLTRQPMRSPEGCNRDRFHFGNCKMAIAGRRRGPREA